MISKHPAKGLQACAADVEKTAPVKAFRRFELLRLAGPALRLLPKLIAAGWPLAYFCKK